MKISSKSFKIYKKLNHKLNNKLMPTITIALEQMLLLPRHQTMWSLIEFKAISLILI